MAMNRAVSVLGTMRTHSEPIFSSVVVTCGLMEMNWQPACLMASQPEYISWSHTVYSMRLFLSGSQPIEHHQLGVVAQLLPGGLASTPPCRQSPSATDSAQHPRE